MRFLPGIIAMAIIVVASNILVQFLLLDGLLTWGAFTYPFAFLVTDVTNRIYGAAAARKIVFAGVITGIICSLIGTQIMLEFGPAVALRTAFGSAIAFTAAQLTDVAVFNRLRAGTWWKAPLVSTLIGATIDTVLFFVISYSGFVTLFGPAADAEVSWAQEAAPLLMMGPEVPLWISLAIADWAIKILLALIALVPFKVIIGRFTARSA